MAGQVRYSKATKKTLEVDDIAAELEVIERKIAMMGEEGYDDDESMREMIKRRNELAREMHKQNLQAELAHFEGE